MPYRDQQFNAVLISLVPELFDTPEIPHLLAEIERVLRQGGRLSVVGLSKEDGDSHLLKLYEWLHTKLPQIVDCRPIYVEQSLKDAGFEIIDRQKVSLWGQPGEIVMGAKTSKIGILEP